VNVEIDVIKIAEPIDEKCYLITFKEDFSFSGTSSTNEIWGEYEIDNTLSNIAITRMGGTKLGEVFDGGLYMQSLKKIFSFSLHENELKLYYNRQDYLFFKSQEI